MDKTIAGLLGAVGALAAAAPSQAATTLQAPSIHEVMQAGAYADLLRPIPNAAALLPASDALLNEATTADVVLVQYHDHHHHRTYRRRPPRRHHHHHHHDSMMMLRDAPKPA